MLTAQSRPGPYSLALGREEQMQSGETRKKGLEIETARTPAANEALAVVLAKVRGSPAQLLEVLYYADEVDFLAIMRLIASLEPDERAKVHAFAKAVRDG